MGCWAVAEADSAREYELELHEDSNNAIFYGYTCHLAKNVSTMSMMTSIYKIKPATRTPAPNNPANPADKADAPEAALVADAALRKHNIDQFLIAKESR